jgi:nickel/cobalt exporter
MTSSLYVEYLYSDPSAQMGAKLSSEQFVIGCHPSSCSDRDTSLVMSAPLQIVLGTLALSLIHALIPGHWLPLVTVGKAEGWSRQETLWITALTGSAHTVSTLLIGVAVGLLGYQFAYNYEIVTHLVAPAALIGLGLVYLSKPLRQRLSLGCSQGDSHSVEVTVSRSGRNKATTVMALAVAMFFLPCLEISAFYLSAGALGWLGIALVSGVYPVVTVLGMVLVVNWGWQSAKPFSAAISTWNLSGYALTGLILIVLGFLTLFIDM